MLCIPILLLIHFVLRVGKNVYSPQSEEEEISVNSSAPYSPWKSDKFD